MIKCISSINVKRVVISLAFVYPLLFCQLGTAAGQDARTKVNPAQPAGKNAQQGTKGPAPAGNLKREQPQKAVQNLSAPKTSEKDVPAKNTVPVKKDAIIEEKKDQGPYLGAGTGMFGETGLWRMMSAEKLKAFGVHAGLKGEYYYGNGFLYSGDSNQRAAADMAFGIVPVDNLEVFLFYQAVSVHNTKAVPTYQLSLGNLTIGLKYAYPFLKAFSAGISLGFGFNTSPGATSFNWSAVSYDIKAVFTIDARYIGKGIPVRFHVNGGAYLIFPDSRFVNAFTPEEHYLLNINLQKQATFGVAVDAPLNKLGLLPFIEATFAYPDGPNYLTPGIKWRPLPEHDFTLDLYFDIGLRHGTPSLAPNTQEYNIIGGASFGFSPLTGAKEITKSVEPVSGLIKGITVDKDERPVGLAIITIRESGLSRLATDPATGEFSQQIKTGSYELLAEKEGFENSTARVDVKQGPATAVKIGMKKKQVDGDALIRITDSGGKPIETAEVQAYSGSRVIDFEPRKGEAGIFTAKLEAGKWYVVGKSESKVATGKTIEVKAGEKTEAEIQLREKSKEQLITVVKDRILLLKKIHFELNSAKITGSSSFDILDTVLDAINSNPRIKKVIVEGHTDNKGTREFNIKLSRERASSVRDYLIRMGIKPELLEFEGYGPDKPIESNNTQRGRDANRRVEFIIVE